MSYLLNDPSSFTDDMIEGFVAANADLVRRVEGGVVRVSATPPGEVAVVIGGGSGHYPAFAGLVGPGLAHGAAMGNVFASPSAQQIYSVAVAAASDAGVLFSYGNYAGDVLNFDQAQERLRAQGIPCRTVVVTDDISSAGATEAHRRRGIAGDFAVFRAAARAADQGKSLDEVWSFASFANDRTRTLGVAFSGCTLPGATAELFSVPPGRMAIGMGIHGEPGIEEQPLPSADTLARLLVDRLLAARPAGIPDLESAPVGVILNGLGSVKYEELFVTYKSVAALLHQAGLTVVQPEIGELVTSFEMAGVSLTLCWLDDELERAWTGPALSAAYRRGTSIPVGTPAAIHAAPADEVAIEAGSPGSRAAAAQVVAALAAIRATIDDHVEELGRLDAVAGDGDHGLGMQRGSAAALTAAERVEQAKAGAGGTLTAAADAWADRAGGTSGALWGLALRAVAARLGDDDVPTGEDLAGGIHDAIRAIAHAGKARRGDKTMLDAMIPFADRLSASLSAGERLGPAWHAAAAEATTAAAATAALPARIGRARTHAPKSVGTPDAGATSFALTVTAMTRVLRATKEAPDEP